MFSAVTSGLVIIVSVGIVMALRSESLRLTQVSVTGSAVHNDEVYTFLQTMLDGTYVGLVPKDSVLFVPKARITREVLEAFPRVASADVIQAGPTTLQVLLHERVAVALWCGDVVPPLRYVPESGFVVDDDGWGVCYLVDETGYIFARAPTYSGHVYPRYWASVTNANPVGSRFISRGELIRQLELERRLRALELDVVAYLLVDERDAELYLARGTRVLFERDTDIETLVESLAALFATPTWEGVAEYIDIRFGNKVYVRVYGQSTAENPSDTVY